MKGARSKSSGSMVRLAAMWSRIISSQRVSSALKLRPDSFVVVAGYGECATGYVPIERAFKEDDSNLHDWCWVAPGSEQAMTAALEAALKKPK